MTSPTTRAERLARIYTMAVSGRAREIREAARLSLRDLAPDIGADAPMLSRWERGLTRPDPKLALAWLEILDRLEALTTVKAS